MSKRKEAGLECGDESEGGNEDASLREGTYKQVGEERQHQCRPTVRWQGAKV